MKELSTNEINEISGAKFKWHINPIHVVCSAIGGFIAGGPFGAGIMIGAALMAQGSGQLVEMYRDEFGNVQMRPKK
jgi:hypothetical protein